MRVRGVQIRALLLPLGVAVISVAALAWYNLAWIPSQQRYLNERNFRLLKTVSAQIKAKVDNFDSALDHAIESVDTVGEQGFADVKAYVASFARDLEVLLVTKDAETPRDSKAEQSLLRLAGDPPRVQLLRNEGKNFLYIGLKHEGILVLAKADVEQSIASFLAAGSAFDALLVVGHDGRVITQSPIGLDLSRVDKLTLGRAAAQSASDTKNGGSATDFESVWMGSNTTSVIIGDAAYKLYVQPIQLSLVRSDATSDEAEEWRLFGFVRAEKLAVASSAISYTYLLLFTAGLAGVLFTIPLLKLHALSPHERLRGTDGVWVTVATFLVTGVVTLGLLDAHYFGHDFRKHVTDDQLERTARSLRASFSLETQAIMRQMAAFEESAARRDPATVAERGALALRPLTVPRLMAAPKIRVVHDESRCTPLWACRARVMADGQSADGLYPFFDVVTWNDSDGWQRAKWSATQSVTPFLNIKKEKVAYWDALARTRRSSDVPRNGLSVLPSPLTGQPVTVFWRALERGPSVPSDKTPASVDLLGQSMALYQPPISLERPVLPRDIKFAVVDKRGRVLFHFERTRSLKENFVQECEDDRSLKLAIAARRSEALSVNYLARPHRLYVMPLTLASPESDTPSFNDPEWSLVVFQDAAVPDTLNLETLTLAVALFAGFGAALAGAWAIHRAFAPEDAVKWFWPNVQKGARYRAVAVTNGLLAVLFLAGVSRLTSAGLLAATGLLVVTAIVAAYVLVVRAAWPAAGGDRWQQSFLWARLSFLFVVSAVPAIACFHVAYDFEAGMLVRSEQLYLAQDRDARRDRIKRRLEPVFQGPGSAPGAALIGRVHSYEADLSPFFGVRDEAPEGAQRFVKGRLDAVLAALHRRYTDVAVDPARVFPQPGAPDAGWQWSTVGPGQFLLTGSSLGTRVMTATAATARVNAWYAVIIAILLGVLFVLLRFVVRPLYALDLYPRPSIGSSNARGSAANLLLVGPPGSGKTSRLRRDPAVLVFDVRTLAFAERRTPSETLTEMVDATGMLSANPEAVVAIDHLEHRLDEPDFRDRMLTFLEELVYRRQRRVWIAADRDPLRQLQDATEPRAAVDRGTAEPENAQTVDLERWARLFQSFRYEVARLARHAIPDGLEKAFEPGMFGDGSAMRAVVVDECLYSPQLLAIGQDVVSDVASDQASSPEDLRRAIGAAAEPYYRAIWSSCSVDERLALRQLADEGVVNSRNHAVLEQLLRNGLIRREPVFRLMNETFRRFVARATPAEQIVAWEHQGVKMPWGSIGMTMATVALGLFGLLVLTQQQLLDAWVGYVPALAPAVPTLLKILASVRPKSAILNT